jgi:biopolymer transport protein TolQ
MEKKVGLDQSLLAFFFSASLTVEIVISILLIASLISWTFILQRGMYLKLVRNSMQAFESKFWSGGDLHQLYRQAEHSHNVRAIEAVFQAGFKEFLRLRQQNVMPDSIMDGVQRAMRIVRSREIDKLELHLPFLATVGSTSPYVGLFGTVWGIMSSFRGLGHVQQATIAMVAPGISEALITTAIGLFTAIPAVIAYNRYASQVERIINHCQIFEEEFYSILQRQLMIPTSGQVPMRQNVENTQPVFSV